MNTAVARKPAATTSATDDAPESVPAAVVLPPRVMINGDKIKLKEHGAQTWLVTAPAEHTLDQVRDPRYCWHKAHSGDIKPGDTIEIRHALRQYIVEILVDDIDFDATAVIGWHQVRDLTKEELTTADYSAAEIKFIDGPLKWAIVQGSQPMKAGFDTRSEARAYLDKKQSRGV